VLPVGAVLLAVDEIGNRAAEQRGAAWAWFVAVSAAGVIGGARSGARSRLAEVDRATRRKSTTQAMLAALAGVTVFRFVGGLPRLAVLGFASGFILGSVVVRAYRALSNRPSQRP